MAYIEKKTWAQEGRRRFLDVFTKQREEEHRDACIGRPTKQETGRPAGRHRQAAGAAGATVLSSSPLLSAGVRRGRLQREGEEAAAAAEKRQATDQPNTGGRRTGQVRGQFSPTTRPG